MASLFMLLITLLMCAASAAVAKGIIIGPGVRGNGMGTAFTAVADDVSSIYWNPAGLARVKGTQAEISGFYVADRVSSNHSFANSVSPDSSDGDFPLPKVYDPANGLPFSAEPSEYKNKEMETNALIPFVAGATNVGGMTFAMGAYGVGGGGGKWNDTVPGTLPFGDTISASLEGQYAFIVYNVSAAKQLTPRLAVGVGLDAVQMTDVLKADKKFDKGATNPYPIADYRMSAERNASGYGLQATAGVNYMPVENVTTSFVFRSGTDIKLSGTAKFNSTVIGHSGEFQTDYDEHYAYPMTYGVGAAWVPFGGMTVAASIDQNCYSAMRNDIKYKTQMPGVFENESETADWKDTTQFRFGAEYRLTEGFAVRGGIHNDPVPLPNRNLTLTEINQFNYLFLSTGVGYTFGPLQIDLCYARGVNDTPQKDGRSYEYPLNTYRFSAGYKF